MRVGWGCGRGIGVCDCQLWERDPPGGAKVQGKRKRESRRRFREKGKESRREEGGGE